MKKKYLGSAGMLVIVGLLSNGLVSLAVSDDSEIVSDQYNRILKQSIVIADGEIDVLVREIVFPAGWQAPTHFHNSDMFVYVIEGEFELTMEHTGKVIYTPGQALEMPAKTIMDARNPSDTNSIKLTVFQVGAADLPFFVPVE